MKSFVKYTSIIISTSCLLYIAFSIHSFLFRFQSTQAVTSAEYRPVSMVTQNSQPLEVVIVGWGSYGNYPDNGLPVSIKSISMTQGYFPVGPAIPYYDPSLKRDVTAGIPTYTVAAPKK